MHFLFVLGSKGLRGPPPPKKKKKKYYFSDRDENLYTDEKWQIKWGNCRELFSIFSIENEVFIDNVKKGGGVPGNELTVQLTEFILILIEAKPFALLYKSKDSFLRISF